MSDFNKDLARGKTAEELVYNLLSSFGLEVENVSDVQRYFYDGDLKIKLDDKEVFLDVKLDTRIAETGNFFIEDTCYNFRKGYEWNGDIYKNYDYVAVVSPQDRMIYFLDWKVVKKNYYKGDYKEIRHDWEMSIGYLVDTYTMSKSWKGLIKKIKY